MKRTLSLLIAFAFVLSMAAPIYAYDLSKATDKFVNGVGEVITSPIELYDSTKAEMDSSDHAVVGLFTGLLKAPFHMIAKAGGGAIDIATFPVE
jgi:hypothetical protein